MTTDLFGNRAIVDSGDRSALDFYSTPSFMVRSLLHYVPEIEGSTVLEPASGDDAIVDVLRDEFQLPSPDERHRSRASVESSTSMRRKSRSGRSRWFKAAFPMLKLAIQYARVGVAFLLRKTFLEPTEERGEWLHTFPPSRLICQPRFSFRGDGNDSVSCDWLIFEKQPNKAAYPIEIDYRAKERSKGSV